AVPRGTGGFAGQRIRVVEDLARLDQILVHVRDLHVERAVLPPEFVDMVEVSVDRHRVLAEPVALPDLDGTIGIDRHLKTRLTGLWERGRQQMFRTFHVQALVLAGRSLPSLSGRSALQAVVIDITISPVPGFGSSAARGALRFGGGCILRASAQSSPP